MCVCVCVCVCVSVCSSGPYCPLQSLHKLFSQPLPLSVADNSCECGCECFRSALVRLASLSGGRVVTASFLISNLPRRPLEGRRSKTKLQLQSCDVDAGPSVWWCWGGIVLTGSSRAADGTRVFYKLSPWALCSIQLCIPTVCNNVL